MARRNTSVRLAVILLLVMIGALAALFVLAPDPGETGSIEPARHTPTQPPRVDTSFR